MADYLADLKKKLSDALRDVAAKVKASPTGAAKAGTSPQSGPPVNITINVAAPKESEDAKTQDERVDNVYLEREAAKAGFYGGSSYAKQVAARFRQAGYGAEGIGSALAQLKHYASLGAAAGGVTGAIGGFANPLVDAAAGGIGALKEILPMIIGVVRGSRDAETSAKAIAAVPEATLLKFKLGLKNFIGSKKEIEEMEARYKELIKGISSNSDHLLASLEKLSSTVSDIQGSIVRIQEGTKAAFSTAILAVSLGDRSPDLEKIKESYESGGDYAAFQFAIRDLFQRKLKEKIGPAALGVAGQGMKELEKVFAAAFR